MVKTARQRATERKAQERLRQGQLNSSLTALSEFDEDEEEKETKTPMATTPVITENEHQIESPAHNISNTSNTITTTSMNQLTELLQQMIALQLDDQREKKTTATDHQSNTQRQTATRSQGRGR